MNLKTETNEHKSKWIEPLSRSQPCTLFILGESRRFTHDQTPVIYILFGIYLGSICGAYLRYIFISIYLLSMIYFNKDIYYLWGPMFCGA